MNIQLTNDELALVRKGLALLPADETATLSEYLDAVVVAADLPTPTREAHERDQQAMKRVLDRMAADPEFDTFVRGEWFILLEEAYSNTVKRKPTPKSFEVVCEATLVRGAFIIALDEGKTIKEAAAIARELINRLQIAAKARRFTTLRTEDIHA